MRVPVREETFNVHLLRTVLVLTRTVTVITSSRVATAPSQPLC